MINVQLWFNGASSLPNGSRAEPGPPAYSFAVRAVVIIRSLIQCGVSSVLVSREGKSPIIPFQIL